MFLISAEITKIIKGGKGTAQEIALFYLLRKQITLPSLAALFIVR